MKPGTGMYARSLNSSTWWTRTDKRVSVSVIDEGWWGNRGECLVSLIYGETVYRSISPCSIVKSTRCPV